MDEKTLKQPNSTTAWNRDRHQGLPDCKYQDFFFRLISVFGKYYYYYKIPDPPYILRENFDQRSAGYAANFLWVCTTTILLWFSVIFIALQNQPSWGAAAVLKSFSRLFRLWRIRRERLQKKESRPQYQSFLLCFGPTFDHEQSWCHQFSAWQANSLIFLTKQIDLL